MRVVRDVNDPREVSSYPADAFGDGRNAYATELEAILAEGWTIANPDILVN